MLGIKDSLFASKCVVGVLFMSQAELEKNLEPKLKYTACQIAVLKLRSSTFKLNQNRVTSAFRLAP